MNRDPYVHSLRGSLLALFLLLADLAAGQFGALVWRQETAPVLLEASIPETLDLRRDEPVLVASLPMDGKVRNVKPSKKVEEEVVAIFRSLSLPPEVNSEVPPENQPPEQFELRF